MRFTCYIYKLDSAIQTKIKLPQLGLPVKENINE